MGNADLSALGATRTPAVITKRIRELWEIRNSPYYRGRGVRCELLRLLDDEMRLRERQWFRIREANSVPIGAIVYELENTWPNPRWRCIDYKLKVWARTPEGDLLVAPAWSDGWTQLRTIQHWARRAPKKTQRSDAH
jgi:hypothetical protein